MTEQDRRLVLIASLFIDLKYFEAKAEITEAELRLGLGFGDCGVNPPP